MTVIENAIALRKLYITLRLAPGTPRHPVHAVTAAATRRRFSDWFSNVGVRKRMQIMRAQLFRGDINVAHAAGDVHQIY